MSAPVRPAAPQDEIAPLLHASSPELYDLYFGGRARALAALSRLAGRRGHTASREVCLVSSAGGEVAGVLAGFPYSEYEPRARRFALLAVSRMPPWRWLGPWRAGRFDAAALRAPEGAWYVDSLAVAPQHRRAGVGRALLAAAEQRAREAGCAVLALDAAENNRAARALYDSWGMAVQLRVALPPSARALGVPVTGWVAYAKAL